MTDDKAINNSLSQYSKDVLSNALKLRELIFKNLPHPDKLLQGDGKLSRYVEIKHRTT